MVTLMSGGATTMTGSRAEGFDILCAYTLAAKVAEREVSCVHRETNMRKRESGRCALIWPEAEGLRVPAM